MGGSSLFEGTPDCVQGNPKGESQFGGGGSLRRDTPIQVTRVQMGPLLHSLSCVERPSPTRTLGTASLCLAQSSAKFGRFLPEGKEVAYVAVTCLLHCFEMNIFMLQVFRQEHDTLKFVSFQEDPQDVLIHCDVILSWNHI